MSEAPSREDGTGTPLPCSPALRAESGAVVNSRRLDSSPRSRVWRVQTADGATAVVKQLVEGPEAAERYAREVAALRLAARAAAPPVAPVLRATDPEQRLLVLEDLDPLRRPGSGPLPADWIVDYASALARLHATARPDDAGSLPHRQGPAEADVDAFLGLAETLGVPTPPGVRGELDDLVDRLTRLDRAPGHALLHGDPCPGNDLHTADGVRFIDFEQAALGSGLTELAYLRIGFPTCWCVTAAPAPLLARAESAYRTAWRAAGGADLGDVGVEDALVDACAGWLLRGDALVEKALRGTTDHLARLPDQDWEWGTATARERLAHRLAVVARTTADRADLRALSRLGTDLRQALLARWPTLRPVPSRRPELT